MDGVKKEHERAVETQCMRAHNAAHDLAQIVHAALDARGREVISLAQLSGAALSFTVLWLPGGESQVRLGVVDVDSGEVSTYFWINYQPAETAH